MTSTNDGKDVKSNKSSGPGGKTYYIELYKSLETRLCEDCALKTRIQHLCEAWRRIHSLCLHSAPNTHSHLLVWLQRHTAKTVLQTEWQSPNLKDEHIKLEEAIDDFINETKAAVSKRNDNTFPWEAHLLERGEWLKTILSNPWGHPVLRVLLDPQGNRPSDNEVLEWLKEDRGVTFVTRLRQLAASKCEDLALLLATAVMERVRATTEVVPDELQTDEAKDNTQPESAEPSFSDILRTEAGFTTDVWELITDLELVLLHKRDKHSQCIALAKKVPLRIGYQLVERLRNRLSSSPREKKLWKNAKDVATLVAQVVIARCMVVPVCVDIARGALYCCARSLVRLVPASRLPEAAAALAAPAATARHLHTLAAAVHTQSSDDMKPFVCELYVRAITAGLNELEKLKLKTEKEPEARSMEQILSTWFTQLGSLLSASPRIQCECALTAFSVHASPAMYEKIKAAPQLPLLTMDIEPKEETTSEFGSWASDSRSQTNFVKTSETLNMKHKQRNNILSTAIFAEGEALGLGAELCQDLTVCLSGPRVKTLSWDMNRILLLENCRTYMERTSGGTRALTTELKYLNLDPSVYQHLPEEEENENDLYYGIEKGYEHLVEFPEPEEIWQDAEDFERTDTACSSGTDTGSIIVRRKKKHKKRLLFSDEEDPLSFNTDVRIEKKKERPHSKERSKERSKDKKKENDKTLIDPETKQQNKEKQKEKSQNKEKKRKEKRERKKKETIQTETKPGSLSSLVGMKVMRIPPTDQTVSGDLIHGVNISNYEVQAKSIKSSHSDNDSNVVFDGLYSMDEMKSPEKDHFADKLSLNQQHILTSNQTTLKKTPLMYGIANLDKNKSQNSTYTPRKDQKPAGPQNSMHVSGKDQKLTGLGNVKSMMDISKLGIPRPQSYGAVNEQVKRSITKLLQFRRQGMKCQTAQTNKSSANVEQKQATAIQKPDFPLQTFISPKVVNVPEIPKAYINKYETEGLKIKREVTPVIQHTGNVTQSPSAINEIKKPAVSNRVTPISTPTNIKDILKVSSYHQDVSHSLQQKPINMSTQSRNSFAQGMQSLRVDNSRQSTTLPDGKNLHDLLRELQDSINAGTGSKALDIKQLTSSNIKKEIKPMSRVPPFIPSPDIKSESTTTLQCAKQILQQKKVENAPNTFSRLSYMHKNKQSDMRPKQARDCVANHNDQLTKQDPKELRHISAFKNAKQKYLRTMGDTVITKVENCSHRTKTIENTNITVKSENQIITKDVPVTPNTLNTNPTSLPQRPVSRNDNHIKVSQPSSVQSVSQTGNTPIKSTYLSEKDQNDLILLLRQQSRINAAGCVSTTTFTNTTEHNAQLLKKPTNDNSLNKCSPYSNTSKSSVDIYSKNVMCSNGPSLDAHTKIMIPSLITPNTKQSESHSKSTEKTSESVIRTPINYTKSTTKSVDYKNKRIRKNMLKNPSSEPMEDWEIVMNAIIAQKTPSRVPSAIDPVQISSSSGSVSENNLRNHRIVRSNSTTSTEISKSVTDISNQYNIIKTQKSQPSTVPKVNTKELSKISHLNTQRTQIGGVKVQTKTDILKRLPSDIQKKQSICETLKEKDPFISGIENSDYDLLEELMDDDLRQEIGELSSDEDTFRSNTILHTKGAKSNITSKNNIVCKSTNIFTQKDKTNLKCVKTMQTTPLVKSNYPCKPSLETTIKEPAVETKVKSNVISSGSNTAVKITSKGGSNLQTHIERQTTGPSLPNKIIDKNSCISHKDKSGGNTQVADSRHVYIATVPPPPPVTANVLVIGPEVFYDPIISMQSQVHPGLRNINPPSQYLPSNTPDITFHTTPFTTTAPGVSSLIIGNTIAVPMEAPTVAPCDSVQSSTLPVNQPYITIPPMSIHAPLKNVSDVNEPDRNNIESKDEPGNDHLLHDTSRAMEYKASDINSKINERKVLSEVQENQKLVEKCDVQVTQIQKIPLEDTTRDSVKDLENGINESKCLKPLIPALDLHETRAEADKTEMFERLKSKRLAIIQRVINHRSHLPPIPLTYTPLITKDQMFVKLTLDEDEKYNDTNSTENYKENKKSLQCRRILLRSSNKDVPNMTANLNVRNPVGRKTRVRLKDDNQEPTNGVIEKSDEKIKKKRKKISLPVKRVSRVVKKPRVKVENSVSKIHTSPQTTGIEDVDIISPDTSHCELFDVENELTQSKILNTNVISVSSGIINLEEQGSVKVKITGGEKQSENNVNIIDNDNNTFIHKNITCNHGSLSTLHTNVKNIESDLSSDTPNQKAMHSESNEYLQTVDANSKTLEDKNTIGKRKSTRMSMQKQVCLTSTFICGNNATKITNQAKKSIEKEKSDAHKVDEYKFMQEEKSGTVKRKSNRISKLTSTCKAKTSNYAIETNNQSPNSTGKKVNLKNNNHDIGLNVIETKKAKQSEIHEKLEEIPSVTQIIDSDKGTKITNQSLKLVEAVSSKQPVLNEKHDTGIPNLTQTSISGNVTQHKNLRHDCITNTRTKITEQSSKSVEAVPNEQSVVNEEPKTEMSKVTQISDSGNVIYHKNVKQTCSLNKDTNMQSKAAASCMLSKAEEVKNKQFAYSEKNKIVKSNNTPISGSENIAGHPTNITHISNEKVTTEQHSKSAESVKNKIEMSKKSFKDVFQHSPVLNDNTGCCQENSDIAITPDKYYDAEVNSLNTRKRSISDNKIIPSQSLTASNLINKYAMNSKSVAEANDPGICSKLNQSDKIKDIAKAVGLVGHSQNTTINQQNHSNKSKMESSSIPESYKNNISFEELPCNQLDANMKRMRIKLSSGKVFTATVYGKMHTTFDSLFEDPAIKSILMSDVKEQKKYTLNIKQITTTNTNSNKPQETRIQEIQVQSKNIMPQKIETINLLSDEEEDEVCYTFKTEFGKYKTSLKDKDVIAQHQIKFNHKCTVKVLRLPIPPTTIATPLPIQEHQETDQGTINFPIPIAVESDSLGPKIETPDVFTSESRGINLKNRITTEIIEIDDSSTDSIDLLKSCPNLPFELISNVSKNDMNDSLKLPCQKISNISNVVDDNSKHRTDIHEKDNITPNLNEDKNIRTPESFQCQRTVNECNDSYNILSKSLNCFVHLTKCDDLVDKYKALEAMRRKCFVELIRCDNICYMPQSENRYDKDLFCNESTDIMPDVSNVNHSKSELSRSLSLSNLNEFPSFNDLRSENTRLLVTTEEYGRSSPVMEIFERIAKLQNHSNITKPVIKMTGSSQKLTCKCSFTEEVVSENTQLLVMTEGYDRSSPVMEIFEIMASLKNCSHLAKEVTKIPWSSQKLTCKSEWLFTKQQIREDFFIENKERNSVSITDKEECAFGKEVCEQPNAKTFLVPSLKSIMTAYFQKKSNTFQVYFKENPKTFRVPTLTSLMTAYFQNTSVLGHPRTLPKYVENNEINIRKNTRNLKRKLSEKRNYTIGKKNHSSTETVFLNATNSKKKCDEIVFTVKSKNVSTDTITVDGLCNIVDSHQIPQQLTDQKYYYGEDKSLVKEIDYTDISIGHIEYKVSNIVPLVNNETPSQFSESEKYIKVDINALKEISQSNDTPPYIQCISHKEILMEAGIDNGKNRGNMYNKIIVDQNNRINNSSRKQDDHKDVTVMAGMDEPNSQFEVIKHAYTDLNELTENINYLNYENRTPRKDVGNTELITNETSIHLDANSLNTISCKDTIKSIQNIVIDQINSIGNVKPVNNNLITNFIEIEKYHNYNERLGNKVDCINHNIDCDTNKSLNTGLTNESTEEKIGCHHANKHVRNEIEHNEIIIDADIDNPIKSMLSNFVVIDRNDCLGNKVDESVSNELITEFIADQTDFIDNDKDIKEAEAMGVVVANNNIISSDALKDAILTNPELTDKLVESPTLLRCVTRDVSKEIEGINSSEPGQTVNTAFAKEFFEELCSIADVKSEIKRSKSAIINQSNNASDHVDNSIINNFPKSEHTAREIENIKIINDQSNRSQNIEEDKFANVCLFEKLQEKQNYHEGHDTIKGCEITNVDMDEHQHTKEYSDYNIQTSDFKNDEKNSHYTVDYQTDNSNVNISNIIQHFPKDVLEDSIKDKNTTTGIENVGETIDQNNKTEKINVDNAVNIDHLEKSIVGLDDRTGNKGIEIINVDRVQSNTYDADNSDCYRETASCFEKVTKNVDLTLSEEKTDRTVYINVIIDEVDKDEQDKLYNEQLNSITNSIHNSSITTLNDEINYGDITNKKIIEKLNNGAHRVTKVIKSKETETISDGMNEYRGNNSIDLQTTNDADTALLTGESDQSIQGTCENISKNENRNTQKYLKHFTGGGTSNYPNTRENVICSSIPNSQKESEQMNENLPHTEKDESKCNKSEIVSVDENVIKNVELLYHGDTDVIIKGIEYDDPVVGMCYVFPIAENVSVSSGSSVRVLNTDMQDSTDEIIQIIEEIDDDVAATSEEIQDVCEDNLKVIIPKITYSKLCQDYKTVLKRVKGKKNLKRKMDAIDPRGSVKKYRKGKNIDYPKITAAAMSESTYSKEYKRVYDYCSSLKFSYSQPFHKEFIDVEDIVKDWPIKGDCSKKDLAVEELCENPESCELFVDNEDKSRLELNTLKLTLTEEMNIEYNENIKSSTNINESNFNMGFGEGSGRVIQNLENVDYISKVSAATLSDVKQPQPFLLSEDYDNCDNVTNVNANYDQIEKARRYVTYIQLRDKVRSFFKQTTIALKHEWIMQHKKLDRSNFPFDHYIRDFIEPCPVEAVVQVVQVGQLPVSAAAQNPVTCDPRVTQVSDVSPSQCSVENSPRDNSPSAIKTEYTELTTADLSLPLVQDYAQHTPTLPVESHEPEKNPISDENIPIETEIKSIVKIELMEELPEEKEECLEPQDISDAHTLADKHLNNIEYSYDTNNSNITLDNSNLRMMYISPEKQATPDNFSQQPVTESFQQQTAPENFPQQKQQNGSAEKTDQIAHAMNAAGITTTSETIANTRAQALVNMLSQKMRQGGVPVNTQTTTSSYSKATSINAMALQQALAQILPPPLNQTNVVENNQQTSNTQVTPQVLHIVQGKNPTGSQITLVDNSQQSVISGPNTTPVLHIVQNKPGTAGATNGAPVNQTNSFSGLSLVDAGLQQGGNQLLHIVNTGAQKNNNTGQLLKRVNLLTNLANVQGSNDQKMVQFVCKSADGKSIQLNAPHQRSMVLRLQPIESSNVQSATPKPVESQELNQPSTASTTLTNKDNATQQEIKSRSVYEENYAKFIQSSNKPATVTVDAAKATSLPKFNQAFGKPVFQEGNQKPNEINSNNMSSVNTGTTAENTVSDCQPNDNTMNLDHMGQISSPPLLLRKSPAQTSQSQSNLVQQIKQTIAPMNIQTMHGGVIYTRQIPVNIGGGQTINLITVPSTELIDDSGQKQQTVSQGEMESSIIKIVPQSQTAPNSEISTDDNGNAHVGVSNENGPTPQPPSQPVLTQMRIKLPMLSKTPQMVSGARVVRPSFFQIQRNVIGGANQPVYQQLVLTAAPPLGQQTIRLPQAQANRQIKVPTENQSGESQMSSSTLEQLREFDMVLEQVKERSTVQPGISTSTFSKLLTPSVDTTDNASSANTASAEPTQVLYSIGNNQSLNVTYVNRKATVTTPTTSTYVRSPDSSGIADSPTSSTHVQIPHTVTTEAPVSETPPQPKPAKVGSKSKSRPKSSSHLSSSMKLNSVPPKTSTQKPLEDEQTTQRILYILAEYKEQVENSPDKDKPAPRRRSNPPSNPSGSSKRKKSSSSSRRPGHRDMSPVHGDDTCRTMGSEDSSCGTSQGDCNESCLDSHSPQDSPRKIVRKLTFEQETPIVQPRPQPQRNVIVADGQTITVARGTTGKPTTAVLMPANYILPVSMVKGGQQIAIVTNRGPKLLTVGGGEGATNALLLQRLIGPAGLKPVLARPGVRHVRLPTAALHNLQAFNLATATTIQPPDSTASPAPAPTPPELVETRATSSPWTDRESQDVKPERGSSPEGSESWNLQSSADPHEYTYEETVRADNMDRTVLDPIPDRYSPDMEAQRIFDKMFDVDTKKSYIVDSHDDSPRCAYDIDASDCDDKPYHQVVHKKDGTSHRQHRLTHVSAAALRHKYAILEHELRLQKSLSEECEDLGVDSPSASELFPEAELLFAASPAHDHTTQDQVHHQSHTPQPTILNQSCIPQPDMDDQIATDQLLQRDMHDDRNDLNLGLEDVGIVTVSEDGMQATIQLDHEEFAKSHPNTTFHSEPTDEGEVQPFTITGLKGRHITSTIFHSNRAPATVLMTAPQTTVISQATAEASGGVKYINTDIDNMINSLPSSHGNNINLSSVLVKDDGLTRFDNILNDSRELHLTNTASAIVHSTGNATQVIRRVCYDGKRDRDTSFLMDEPDALIAGDDAKMVGEDSSRDATLESMTGDVDDDRSSPERHTELFWESNSASERSESRRPLDFSSDSDKCCKSPSYDETNSTDSSGVGTHMRLDSVIKEARGIDRSGSADGSSADDTHPPLRTYPPKRMYHPLDGDMERSLTGKTRAGERSPDLEIRRRASGRGVVKRGCHCCNGSPVPPRPKKSRQRKPTLDFSTH